MLFAPRLSERNPFPIATPTDPTEVAATILRQMNPHLDSKYYRFPVVPKDAEVWKRSEKNFKGTSFLSYLYNIIFKQFK